MDDTDGWFRPYVCLGSWCSGNTGDSKSSDRGSIPLLPVEK